MIRRSAFLLYLLVISVLTFSQHLPYRKYTSKDGLISDRITAIAQDDKGFMWFGSYFGICRYDATGFKKIDLPPRQKNKYVNCILPANGKIYAGFLFGGGLAEYDNGLTKAYFINGRDSILENEFMCMYDEGNGSILLANNAGCIYRFNNGVFTKVFSLQLKNGNTPTKIIKDRYNTVWAGTSNGLYLIPAPYTSSSVYYKDENIFSLLKDDQGKVWFCHTNGKKSWIESASGSKNGMLTGVNEIWSSDNLKPVGFSGNLSNGIWAINYADGLTHINDRNIQQYPLPLDLHTDISAVFADRENNVWISNEPGIVKVSNFNSQTYLFDELAAGGGDLHIAPDSLLWVNNSKSLYIVSESGIQKKTFHKNIPNYYGLIHIDRQENIWLGFWHQGLLTATLNNRSIENVKDLTKQKNQIIKASSLVEDSKGNIWVAGAGGIFHFRGTRLLDTYHPLNENGDPAFINCITIDEASKSLWVGMNSAGVLEIKYEYQADGSLKYTEGRSVTGKDGLKDFYIRSILFDEKNNLWVGTRFGGIYKLVMKGNELEVIDCNEASGITCTRVTDIAAENNKAVWFATCNGIYRYHHQTQKWTHYNTSDGLLNAEVFSIAVDARNDVIWALTAQGLTRMKINGSSATAPPLVNITAVDVAGHPDTSAFNLIQPAKYNYSQNSIRFEFAGASFIDEKNISYKYILEGHNKNWSGPVTSNSVNYASLAPGKYTFKVMAKNSKGQWSKEPAGFSFEIVRPFYKSSWFIFLCITMALFILYLVRIQRLKQRYKIEKLRLNIARDLHDDIGSTLGSINILSKTAARKIDKNISGTEGISPIFQKIGESAEHTLEAMDDIVWSINPDKDRFNDLMIRMREFAIPLLEAGNISFSFEINGNYDQPLPMDVRRNVFLVYKEAIYNILKHSGASHVKISIQAGHQFIMYIEDNGKGFVVDSGSRRNGLNNMLARAEAVGGKVKVESEATGTQVYFMASIR